MAVDVAAQRLGHQRIDGERCATPHEVVSHLGCMQAQDYLGALWAVGLRMRESTEGEVERALAERTIVRTWPLRGTLHFVAAEDVHWILDLLAPRIIQRHARGSRASTASTSGCCAAAAPPSAAPWPAAGH